MREEIRHIQALMEGRATSPIRRSRRRCTWRWRCGSRSSIEGHAGVGKTEIAKVLARMLETDLIRLQCYEGLDAPPPSTSGTTRKQILRIRLEEGDGAVAAGTRRTSSADFLLKRPLLAGHHAARAGRPCCSSTRSTAPTTGSRRSSSRCSRTSR